MNDYYKFIHLYYSNLLLYSLLLCYTYVVIMSNKKYWQILLVARLLYNSKCPYFRPKLSPNLKDMRLKLAFSKDSIQCIIYFYLSVYNIDIITIHKCFLVYISSFAFSFFLSYTMFASLFSNDFATNTGNCPCLL